MTTEDEALERAKTVAEERIHALNEALSAAAFGFGAVTMKLAIGAALRDAGLYAEATIAVSVPPPVFRDVLNLYETALSEVRTTKEVTQ